jgi:signal transduction histidine kinase
MFISYLLLLIITILNFALASLVYFKNRKNPINISFALLALSVSVWALTNGVFQATSNLKLAYDVSVLSYIAAALIASSGYWFSSVFPETTDGFSKIKKRLLLISVLIIVLLTLWPGFVIKDVAEINSYKYIVTGSGLYLFAGYVAILFFLSFVNLIRKYRVSTGRFKTQLKYVFLGTFIAAIFGTAFNLLLPILGNYRYVWLGPDFTIFLVALTAYSIVKYNLMNIRVVLANMLVFIIGVILFSQIFLTTDLQGIITRALVFVLYSYFAYLLVRSVLREIKQREELSILNKELKRTSDDLKIANKHLKKLDKAKDTFIHIASHQLKTPLTANKGYLSMILGGDYGHLPESLKDPVNSLYRNNDHLNNIINELLDVSRITTGTLTLNPEPTDLSEIAKLQVEELIPQAKQKGLDLKFEKLNKQIPKVNVDPKMIKEVIMNFLTNAISYTEKGFVKLTVNVEKDEVILKVIDSGIGIPESEQSQLFSKFFRADNARQIRPDGTGIGLYLAKSIIERSGGKIIFESRVGRGSAFGFKIPQHPS